MYMKHLMFLQLCLFAFVCTLGTVQLTSIINSDKIYEASRHNNEKVFAIDLERLETTQQSYTNRCRARERKIFVNRQQQIYRLGSSKEDNRTQSLFDSLTKLQDQQKFIMQFNKIGNYVFLINTDNEGFFIHNENPSEKIKVQLYAQKSQMQIKQRHFVLNFNNRALVINKKNIIICSDKDKICQEVKGYSENQQLRYATIFQQDTQYYLFVLTGQQIIIYGITANAKLQKQNSYSSQFFGKDQAFFQTVLQGPNHTLLFLDALKGIWQCTYTNDMTQLSNPKSVFDQPACYKMASENQGQYLVLTCSMNLKSFFVMELIKSPVLGLYEPQSPIFRNQNIYDIDINGQTIMSRVYSGIRFFWASKSLENPYPYDFLHAGDIFLHNALQAKIIQFQNKQYVYLSSQDQMRRYQLMIKQPYILCFSGTPISETYKVKYTYLCPDVHKQKTDELSQICHDEQILKYEAWEHKQVRINTMIFPLMMLIIGVSCMFITLWKFYSKFKQDIAEAREKFDTEQIKAEDFEIDE